MRSATSSEGKYTNRIGLNVDSPSSSSPFARLLSGASSPSKTDDADEGETHRKGKAHPHKFAIASNSCTLCFIIRKKQRRRRKSQSCISPKNTKKKTKRV
jgi:hypothetical protein